MLTLTRLREAFRLCAGDHASCTIYHQIRRDDEWAESRLVARSA